MPFKHAVGDSEPSETVTELFESDRGRLGYVANYTRLFAATALCTCTAGPLRAEG